MLCLVFINSIFREARDREIAARLKQAWKSSTSDSRRELFWYIFTGEPIAKDELIELSDDVPGLGPEINEAELTRFEVIE